MMDKLKRWWQKLWHSHIWEDYHPSYTQADVLQKRCTYPGCRLVYHQGVRGESNQIIPYGFSAKDGKSLYGDRDHWSSKL